MHLDSPEQVYSEISQRIKTLEVMSGDDLKNEMMNLKKALLENPQACMLLLPDEIGAMVSSLRKITGIAIATASAKTGKKREPKATAKKMTPEELAAALDDEDF